jgi:hypothetical protein
LSASTKQWTEPTKSSVVQVLIVMPPHLVPLHAHSCECRFKPQGPHARAHLPLRCCSSHAPLPLPSQPRRHHKRSATTYALPPCHSLTLSCRHVLVAPSCQTTPHTQLTHPLLHQTSHGPLAIAVLAINVSSRTFISVLLHYPFSSFPALFLLTNSSVVLECFYEISSLIPPPPSTSSLHFLHLLNTVPKVFIPFPDLFP